MNWALQPLMYALVYLLIYTTVSSEKEKEKALYAFLAGAVVTVVYGFFQYANAAGMAADMEAQSWVDPERFPLLRRRMYSTLEIQTFSAPTFSWSSAFLRPLPFGRRR